ncbi:MAG: hypothetical protein B5M53_03905 [Candidatus Cloacimonas sp. 4484_209]|nr:MAG: hypothetical protein B5M53_03905 [Candidatus Cloacimonas sp. 4484_209]RKX93657.1 MAG: hypothetical protein DRP84_08120 [Spirochaetota bacterium]
MILLILCSGALIDLKYFVDKGIENNKFMLKKKANSISGFQGEYPYFYILPTPYLEIASDFQGEKEYTISIPVMEPSIFLFLPINGVNKDLRAKSLKYGVYSLKKELTFIFYEYLYYYKLCSIQDSILEISREILRLEENEYKSGRIEYEEFLKAREDIIEEQYNLVHLKSELRRSGFIIKEILKDTSDFIPVDTFSLITLEYDSIIGNLIKEINDIKKKKMEMYKINSILSLLPSIRYVLSSNFETTVKGFEIQASIDISRIINNINYLNTRKRFVDIERKYTEYENRISIEKNRYLRNAFTDNKNKHQEILSFYEELYKKCEEDYKMGKISYYKVMKMHYRLLEMRKRMLEAEYSLIKEAMR